MKETNTLAYYCVELITAVKFFLVLASAVFNLSHYPHISHEKIAKKSFWEKKNFWNEISIFYDKKS